MPEPLPAPLTEDQRAARLALLEHNFREVDWVKRFDQQIVYVPLVAVGGAIGLLMSNPDAAAKLKGFVCYLPVVLVLLWTSLMVAIWRNQSRHQKLMRTRDCLIERFGIGSDGRGDLEFYLGRALYALLLTGGLILAGFVVAALL